ncbi:hypothetical protein AYI68_g5329 [Smittium mucronatum]|uniref:Uncharacterized protein n=1 Tax=Smittium mucronatum TaxID=133383 RepID=A0A1R0GUK7_9FUNG|nr:hypothetical protein AYI68_g5329 [Smittium mucronatum]
MFIKSASAIIAIFAYSTSAGSCGNHGAARCVSANGSSSSFVKCEYGNEVTYNCADDRMCYGSGVSGVMCIKKNLASKRQTTSSSTFSGYEANMNQLIDGMNGDVNSLNTWLNSARQSMFTNKNTIPNIAIAMNKGINAKSSAIGNSINNALDMRTTTAGRTAIIKNAKKFMGAANSNQNDIGYFLSDLTNNAALNPNARVGLAQMMTNTYATSRKAITPAGQNNVISALTNLQAATLIYQPSTFGSIFRNGLTPSQLGPQIYRASNGDANGTDAMLVSAMKQVKGRTSGLAGFYAAAARPSNKVASNVSPAIINNVLNRYRTVRPSNVGIADTINGIANAFVKIGTKYNSQVDAIVRNYSDDEDVICPHCDPPSDCGCTDSNYNGLLLSVLLLLIASLTTSPSSGCCYSPKSVFTTRALMI